MKISEPRLILGTCLFFIFRVCIPCLTINFSGLCVSCTNFVALAKKDADKRRGPPPESEWNVKGVWKRVSNDPATYIPTGYSVSASLQAEAGDWVVDPRDGKRFFIPNAVTGGYTPKMLESDALKMTKWPEPRPIIVYSGESWVFAQ